ncbi:GNAT family N-acetyltransferase, partial [Ruminococcaceae bacterium OttesenSCG-928-L11]|nr:GNAT family N-acetyltransferase [Ruminococcaceae bacterium OttesenSCG-928-L11]
MHIRTICTNDLPGLLELYTFLHEDSVPEIDDSIWALWANILQDPNHHILVGEKDGRIVSSCVLVIIPNLTRGQRPYALIENVVTHAAYRGRGYASQILEAAGAIASGQNCYKIMLLTGSRQESTLRFYEK